MQRRHSKREEVGGLDQFRPDRRAFVGGIGGVIGGPSAIAEFDEAGVFDAVRLRLRDWKDHAFADVLLRLEDDLDFVADRAGIRYPIRGLEASREVGSTLMLPSAEMVPARNVSDDT